MFINGTEVVRYEGGYCIDWWGRWDEALLTRVSHM
jgi:hypothetical protein